MPPGLFLLFELTLDWPLNKERVRSLTCVPHGGRIARDRTETYHSRTQLCSSRLVIFIFYSNFYAVGILGGAAYEKWREGNAGKINILVVR